MVTAFWASINSVMVDSLQAKRPKQNLLKLKAKRDISLAPVFRDLLPNLMHAEDSSSIQGSAEALADDAIALSKTLLIEVTGDASLIAVAANRSLHIFHTSPARAPRVSGLPLSSSSSSSAPAADSKGADAADRSRVPFECDSADRVTALAWLEIPALQSAGPASGVNVGAGTSSISAGSRSVNHRRKQFVLVVGFATGIIRCFDQVGAVSCSGVRCEDMIRTQRFTFVSPASFDADPFVIMCPLEPHVAAQSSTAQIPCSAHSLQPQLIDASWIRRACSDVSLCE